MLDGSNKTLAHLLQDHQTCIASAGVIISLMFVSLCRLVDSLSPFPGQQHLDVAGGTGDVAFRVLRAIRAAEQQHQQSDHQPAASQRPVFQAHAHQQQLQATASLQPSAATATAPGHVTVCDINANMLEVGKSRAASQGLTDGLSWVQGNAEQLPFEEASMDSYSIAFGIRNVTNRDAALSEALRVLKKGGRFICLEFSQVCSLTQRHN